MSDSRVKLYKSSPKGGVVLLSTILLYVVYLLVGYRPFMGYLGSIFCVFSSARLIYRAWKAKNPLFITLFTFIFLYAWPSKLFFFDGLYFSAHHLDYTYDTAFFAVIILSLFFQLLGLFVKIPQGPMDLSKLYRRNSFIFYSVFLFVAVIIFLYKPVGNVYMGEGDSESFSVYEYALIFFVILYFFANSVFKKSLFWLLGVLYVFFTLRSGGRVSIIMFFLLLLLVEFQQKINYKKLLLLLLIGIWGMNTFEKVRSNPSMILRGNIAEIANPFSSNDSWYQISNFGDVFWASERLLILSKEGYLTTTDRLQSAVLFLMSPFSVGTQGSDLANLATYKREYYSSGGGSLAPVVFFMFGGVFGLVLLAWFVGRCLSGLKHIKADFKSFYIFLLVITIPRWFAYYPIQLIKFCIFGAMIIAFVYFFDLKTTGHQSVINQNDKYK